jgi:hypothetical protein
MSTVKLARAIYINHEAKIASLILPRLAAAAAANKKLGVGVGSLGAIEMSNILLRAQAGKNELLNAALKANDIEKAKQVLGSSVHDMVLDKKVSDLINNSFLMSPIESGKYLLGLK